MTDNKLTDNEIIKGLGNEIHLAEYVDRDYCEFVKVSLIKSTLDLINRLQAQNEVYETCNARKDETIKSLESRLKKLQMQFDDIGKMYSEIKAEAYKECLTKVENHIKTHCNPYGKPDFDYDTSIKILNYLDNLLKELVGDK